MILHQLVLLWGLHVDCPTCSGAQVQPPFQHDIARHLHSLAEPASIMEMYVEYNLQFLIPVVRYANVVGWVCQNTTVIGSYLLVRQWRQEWAGLLLQQETCPLFTHSHTHPTHTLLLQDQLTQKKRPQSQRQHLHRNTRSAIQTSHNKRYSPELRQSPLSLDSSTPSSTLT